MSWVKLAESSEKSSICTDNNQDLEDISKIQVDKMNSGFPFTKQNIDNKISKKYLIPNKFLTTWKTYSTIKNTNYPKNASNADSKDSNIPWKLPLEPKQSTNSDINHKSSNLSMSLQQKNHLIY